MLIIVEDINDNPPIFLPFHTTISLPETTRPKVIETVEAFDEDEGRFGQVLYQLEVSWNSVISSFVTLKVSFLLYFFFHLKLKDIDKEKIEKTFTIDTVEGKGVISLLGSLDYETKSLYQLKILAIVSLIYCFTFFCF